mmetsp:Transcript_24731/g.27632  ORF Transcript_24731/g.27632 Transcript_24731/m.27632 type:complete len:175 (-) Transcript_24731:100-624(-)
MHGQRCSDGKYPVTFLDGIVTQCDTVFGYRITKKYNVGLVKSFSFSSASSSSRYWSSSSTTTTPIAGRGGGGGEGEGFYKPDVVFFGDTVPKHRVALCHDAVQECDGILAIGTSLTVHSVYRHVRAASTKYGVSTAIVNVGDTRAELEGLENIVKIEAPVGDVLQRCVELLKQK